MSAQVCSVPALQGQHSRACGAGGARGVRGCPYPGEHPPVRGVTSETNTVTWGGCRAESGVQLGTSRCAPGVPDPVLWGGAMGGGVRGGCHG